MVPPCSDRVSRAPPYSRTRSGITYKGLSPSMANLSRLFYLSKQGHWPGPRSLATTSGVSVDVLSSGYLDVSVRQVRLLCLCIQQRITRRWGFPIRKCADQSLLSAPRTLSQSATSFIASQCQGIHEMPLRRLISTRRDKPNVRYSLPTTIEKTDISVRDTYRNTLFFLIVLIRKTYSQCPIAVDEFSPDNDPISEIIIGREWWAR